MRQLKYIFFSLSLILCLVGHAQLKVDGKVTGRHAKAVNQAKQDRKKIKETNRLLKDQRKAKELYQKRFEELRNQHLDRLETDKLSIKDSIAISNRVLESPDFPANYRELINNPVSFESSLEKPQVYDSVLLEKGSQLAEQVAKEHFPAALGEQNSFMDIQNPINLAALVNKKPNPNLIKPDAARTLFKKIDPKQFQDTQAQLLKLKKKYSQLPDTRFPEEGTKRNALQKLPFKKRLYFGGNLTLSSTDPLIIGCSFQSGYWINKKWMMGTGFTIREQFGKGQSTLPTTGDGYGFSVFTRYDLLKGLFFWMEGETQRNGSVFGGEATNSSVVWQQAYLAGVGRQFSIGKIQMMSLILYDFNYRDNELNQRPLVLKIGVIFSK
ncbi:MAG: hypothetical protein AAF391_00815 [Bacteroidota bacterium]